MQWPSGQLIAEDTCGNIIGAICGSIIDNKRVSVSLLSVKKNFRGQGTGTEILNAFYAICMIEGYKEIQLEVRVTNIYGIGFYENNGFMIVEFLKSFYNDGGDGYRMIRILQSSMIDHSNILY